MVDVWRLTPPAFARLLNGEGSRRAGGRWNSPGRPVVYASAHLSLCVLEVFVHLPPALRDELPDLEAVCISLPDTASAIDISTDQFEILMADSDPAAAFRVLGDEWLARGAALLLRAPSVLVPEELNVMLNPAHPDMRRVGVSATRSFRFDPRLASRHPQTHAR